MARAKAAWLAVPLLFAAPVAVGLIVSVVRVVSSPWPDLGWPVAISADAGSFFVGQAPYGDPDQQYTGQFYTPLFPLLVSVLDHVRFWEGWPLLLNIVATIAGIALVAWMALPERKNDESHAART